MGGDHFAPGTWHIEAWMESAQGSTRGQPGATLTDTVKLTAEQASEPPVAVFFSRFYHGAGTGDIRFRGGRIEGSFHQRAVDDISAHEVPVTGTYDSEHFRVTFGYRAFGMTMNQVAEGKLIEPLR
jgi:hypothetical protein